MPVSVPDLLKGFGLSEESVDRVRLSRGVVGRTTYAVIVALLVLAVVAGRAETSVLVWIAVIAAVVFTIYFVGVLVFAHLNPSVAVLEGAELVHWRQIELASKGAGPLVPGPAVPPPGTLLTEAATDGDDGGVP